MRLSKDAQRISVLALILVDANILQRQPFLIHAVVFAKIIVDGRQFVLGFTNFILQVIVGLASSFQSYVERVFDLAHAFFLGDPFLSDLIPW